MSMNKEFSKVRHREQVRKHGCVPLIWKEKPRQPNENFIIQTPTVDTSALRSNFVISVPFRWEEKPGKLRPCSLPRLDSVLSCSPIREASAEGCDEDCEDDGCDGHDDDLFELDLEAFAFDENNLPINCFSGSTPCLLANCMSTLSEISHAIPTENLASATDEHSLRGSGRRTSFSEGDSSYIEFVFPLASPHSSFLQEAFAAENRLSDGSAQRSERPSCCRVSCVHVKRMPPTLGHFEVRELQEKRARNEVACHAAEEPRFFPGEKEASHSSTFDVYEWEGKKAPNEDNGQSQQERRSFAMQEPSYMLPVWKWIY